MVQFVDLGEDIILSHIIPYVAEVDFIALAQTCRELHAIITTNNAYHILYLKLFGSKPVPLNLDNYCWKTLFNLRVSKRTKLCTWGCNDNFRLGNSSDKFMEFSTNRRGCNVPLPVDETNEYTFTNIVTSGFSFQFLTASGEVLWTGNRPFMFGRSSPGPRGKDYNARRNIEISTNYRIPSMPGIFMRYSRGVIPEPAVGDSAPRETNRNLTLPPEEQDNSLLTRSKHRPVLSNPLIHRIEMPVHTKIVAISSGREHFIALDNNGRVHSWDGGSANNSGVEMVFPGIADDKKVISISAGWNLSTCYIEEVGLVVWWSREVITQEQFERGDLASKAKYVVVPGTSQGKIIDFMTGIDYVLFIRGDGKLYRFDIDAVGLFDERIEVNSLQYPFEVTSFNSWLANYNTEIVGGGAKFSKVTGCYNNFAIFSDNGKVLLGDTRGSSREENAYGYEPDGDDDNDNEGVDGSDRGPKILPELQDRKIKDVVIGDYHHLALTDDGQLLSWGSEPNRCGCLGLGDIDGDVSVPTPVKLPWGCKPGKWLAISAAGWQSCGIFIEDEE